MAKSYELGTSVAFRSILEEKNVKSQPIADFFAKMTSIPVPLMFIHLNCNQRFYIN